LRYRVFCNSPRSLTWLAVASLRSSPISSSISAFKRRWSFLGQVNWSQIIGWSVIHIGVVLAPLTFSWSGLVVCLVLYLLVGLGVTMGYHRLLTHRSFQTPRPVEYVLALLGSLANQGGPLQWVAVHRIHHQHSDDEGDPHSPRDGVWWSHMLWWMLHVPAIHEPVVYQRYVPDLARDPVHRFLQRYHFLLTLGLGGALFGLGHLWGGVGFSWVVWGMFVRTTVLYHATWLVNSATHLLGYRTYATRDRSTNLWWVALITLGEGWHNNHHAFPRSARHGIRWWELDVTFLFIRILGILRLARQIHVPGKILRPALASSSPNGAIADSESNHHG
jgi:sn-1 stearoyl-lipid 9-desaturase